jgi:CRISPR-associated protein Cmr2
MSDALLTFTFSPVQPFISEARRAADLYTGSRILVELAGAAARSIESDCQRLGGRLISPSQTAGFDIPNVIVARLPVEACQGAAEEAKGKLLARWAELCQETRNDFLKRNTRDPVWDAIWERQTREGYYWEIYWAATSLEGQSYPQANLERERIVGAVKRLRQFVQPVSYSTNAPVYGEPGQKDTLSGRRQALRTAKLDAKEYWTAAGKKYDGSVLQPGGRERLDAFGIVKRFSPLAEKGNEPFYRFPSTSSVASATFLKKAKNTAAVELNAYLKVLDSVPQPYFFNVSSDPIWPHDGDLLYQDTLTEKRLESDYGVDLSDPVTRANTADKLALLGEKLRQLYRKAGERPSPYYAIIVLDGDDMGKRVSGCQDEEQHFRLSAALAGFAERVPEIASEHLAWVIYNGGDDVLALAPLATAIPLAQRLAEEFAKTGGTASAGIALTHHRSPLGAALRAAHQAEGEAKKLPGKAAVCVHLQRRSGETRLALSPWQAIGQKYIDLITLFQEEALASRFAYEVWQSTHALPEPDEKFNAMLRLLLSRHRNKIHSQAPDPAAWADLLSGWARDIPIAKKTEALANWLILARFVAQGGAA